MSNTCSEVGSLCTGMASAHRDRESMNTTSLLAPAPCRARRKGIRPRLDRVVGDSDGAEVWRACIRGTLPRA
eukprot:3653602-Prymnesium_polylepis.2